MNTTYGYQDCLKMAERAYRAKDAAVAQYWINQAHRLMPTVDLVQCEDGIYRPKGDAHA